MKRTLRDRAVLLRKEGKTYLEILHEVPVSKSTLSLWLRSVQLSKQQIQRITYKKIVSAKKGALVRKMQRIDTIQKIRMIAKSELTKISLRELWILGTALYWAEGAKEKTSGKSQCVVFSNSDPRMIRLFIKWLRLVFKIPEESLFFEIYIHNSYMNRIDDIQMYWALETGYPITKFDRIYYKYSKDTRRSNKGNGYFGLVRVKVRKSTNINRRIAGWIEALSDIWGVV